MKIACVSNDFDPIYVGHIGIKLMDGFGDKIQSSSWLIKGKNSIKLY